MEKHISFQKIVSTDGEFSFGSTESKLFPACFIFGVSLFSSYFNEHRLECFVRFASRLRLNYRIFLADTPTIHTFMSFGYSQREADRKMKAQARWMKNKILRVIEKVGYERIMGVNPESRIIDGVYLESNAVFMEAHTTYQSMFQNDPEFRQLCMETVQDCYNDSLRTYAGKERQSFNPEIAVKYILWELPMICNSRHILDVSQSIFCYHREMKLLNSIFNHSGAFRKLGGENKQQLFALLSEIK